MPYEHKWAQTQNEVSILYIHYNFLGVKCNKDIGNTIIYIYTALDFKRKGIPIQQKVVQVKVCWETLVNKQKNLKRFSLSLILGKSYKLAINVILKFTTK